MESFFDIRDSPSGDNPTPQENTMDLQKILEELKEELAAEYAWMNEGE
tara:strand:- start:1951 stop:2094 length:144 start_codon:yes stop_codon:yes gene_type:complete